MKDETTLYQAIKQNPSAVIYHDGCDTELMGFSDIFGIPRDERFCTEHEIPICDLCKKELGKEERQVCDNCRQD